VTFFFGCCKFEKQNQDKFNLPTIIHKYKTDNTILFSEESVAQIDPRVLNKYKFSDTIRIPDEKNKEKEYGSTKSHFDYGLVGLTDSTLTDGLEIVTDYTNDISFNQYGESKLYNYYPVYVVNQTPNPKGFLGKDGIAFGLQEALDTAGVWRPIEGRGWDFCGCCKWGLKIEPQEFLVIIFRKYSGNYKTKIRVRIKNGDNIYVSKPFYATINEKQLYLEKNRGLYRDIIEDKTNALEYKFYGARPSGMDDKDFYQHEPLE
jgi:hypothetical protein